MNVHISLHATVLTMYTQLQLSSNLYIYRSLFSDLRRRQLVGGNLVGHRQYSNCILNELIGQYQY